MSQLYNHTTGKWEVLPDADIDAAVLNGTHTFETGVDVPVVAPDGALTSIKSDKLYDAFKDGYRWQTQADRDADFDLQNYRIKKEHFDNAGMAFGLGAARGATLGLSDVALEAGGLGDETKAVKDFSPTASAAGSVAGLVGSSLLLPGAGVAKGGQAAFEAGEGVAGALTGALGAGRAAKAVQTVAGTALGSAAEGAFYGLGEGISEAALGKPEDVVNNLAAGVGLGALTGGIFGAALGTGQAAAPYLKKAFDVGAGAVTNVATKALRAVEKNRITAALTREGEETLAAKYADIANTPAYEDIRQMFMNGEFKAADAYADEVRGAIKNWQADQTELKKGLTGYIKTATADEQQALADALQDAGGDAWKASRGIYKKIQDTSNAFRDSIPSYTDLADTHRLADVTMVLEGAAKKLQDAGTAEGRRFGKMLSSYSRKFQDGISEGEEFTLLDNLKRNVLDEPAIRQIADGRVRKELHDVWKYSKEALTSDTSTLRDEFKAFSRTLDTDYTAYNALRDLLGRKAYKASAVGKLAADPGKLDAIEPLFQNYADFVPELQKLKDAAGNAGRRTEALEQIRAKISNMKMQNVNNQLSTNDLEQIIKESGFITGNPMQRVEKMQQVSTWLKGAENRSPLDTAVYIEKQLKGGPSKLEKYLPFEQQMGVMDQLAKVKAGDPSMLTKAAQGAVGYAVGGPAGAVLGATIRATNLSPVQIMRGLSRVERATQAGVRGVQTATKAAVDALTSAKFRTGVVSYKSAKPDRERFRQVSENIKKMINPQTMADTLADMPGTAVPQVHQALAMKLSVAANYLNTHLPEDPTASYSIYPNKTKWVPSDLDLAKFQRRVEVVNDPTVAIHRISEGTVTPEQVDALKNVYPEIFAGLQQEIISGIMENKDPPPYRARLVLASVFGIPADISMTPNFVQQMQSSFQQQDQGGRPTGSPDAQPRGKPQKPIDIKPMNSIATQADQATFKVDIK